MRINTSADALDLRATPVRKNRLASGPMLPPTGHPGRKRWKKRLIRFGFGVGILCALIVFHRPLLTGFARLFRVDNPARSDALLILLGGPETRPVRTAQLYREGIAPIVLIGMASMDPTKVWKETEVTIGRLIALGVPRKAIVVMPGIVTSTKDEAEKLREYGRTHAIRRVTVVTTAFHTARALWIVNKTLKGSGIEIRMAAATNPALTEENWYTTDEGLVTYFSEAIKTVYYRLRY